MIRKGTAEDAGRLGEIARTVARGLHAEGIDQWSEVYPSAADFRRDAEAGGLFVWEEEGILRGSLSLLPDDDAAYRAIAWPEGFAFVIHRVMVDPVCRKTGIGAALLAEAVRTARCQGAVLLKVDTHPDNPRMRRFLEKAGFREVGWLASIHRVAYAKSLEE